jgi:hypothetical protein
VQIRPAVAVGAGCNDICHQNFAFDDDFPGRAEVCLGGSAYRGEVTWPHLYDWHAETVAEFEFYYPDIPFEGVATGNVILIDTRSTGKAKIACGGLQ